MTALTRRSVLLGLSALGVLPALTARAATTHAVTIKGMKFTPADLTIAAGDTVTFTNQDSAPHTATSDAGAFDTGRLNKGASSSLTFGGKGDFAYHCNIHRSMKAVIHVA